MSRRQRSQIDGAKEDDAELEHGVSRLLRRRKRCKRQKPKVSRPIFGREREGRRCQNPNPVRCGRRAPTSSGTATVNGVFSLILPFSTISAQDPNYKKETLLWKGRRSIHARLGFITLTSSPFTHREHLRIGAASDGFSPEELRDMLSEATRTKSHRRVAQIPLPPSPSNACLSTEQYDSPLRRADLCEMAPTAKVGGLGDVLTRLAQACLSRGHKVDIMLPFYECLQKQQVNELTLLTTYNSFHDGSWVPTSAYRGLVSGIPIIFIEPSQKKI
ncbi:starch synthase [Sarracenia purpurea var. burkii]